MNNLDPDRNLVDGRQTVPHDEIEDSAFGSKGSPPAPRIPRAPVMLQGRARVVKIASQAR